jgi:hypothetical protein
VRPSMGDAEGDESYERRGEERGSGGVGGGDGGGCPEDARAVAIQLVEGLRALLDVALGDAAEADKHRESELRGRHGVRVRGGKVEPPHLFVDGPVPLWGETVPELALHRPLQALPRPLEGEGDELGEGLGGEEGSEEDVEGGEDPARPGGGGDIAVSDGGDADAAIISTATNTFEGFRQFGSIASKTTSSRMVPTTVERKMTAAKAMKMQKTFSTDVTGRRSPYPTVASVTMAK